MKTELGNSCDESDRAPGLVAPTRAGGVASNKASKRTSGKFLGLLASSVNAFVACSLALVASSCVTSCTVPVENELVAAAGKDDLAKVKKLAASGVGLDLQQQGMQGYTPLIATTFHSGTNVFCYLLSAGAKVDARNRNGETALMTAAMLGDANLFKIAALINAGADVNARDRDGTSVLKFLHFAGMGSPPRSISNALSLLKTHGARE